MITKLTFATILGLVCLLLCISATYAQAPKDTSADNKPIFKIGVSFINNDIYYGRSDTINTPTIIPLIKYIFSSGIYLSGDLNYVTNRKNNKLDGGSLAAGYDFSITDDLEGSASFAKLFYNGNSTQVGSANRANFNINLNYNVADIVTPSIAFDYDINRSGVGNDVYINIGLSHDFEFEKVFSDNDNLVISPSIELNSGTQNFYSDYVARRTIRNKKITTAQTALLASEKAELAQYKLLDYELSLPVEYESGVITVNFTPTYALAQNKLPAGISSTLRGSGNVFYFQLGLTLKF